MTELDMEEIRKWRELVFGERACYWAQGEFCSRIRRELGREGLGVLASAVSCTIASLVQRADLHEAFEPGQRMKEKCPSWHRSLKNAAHRTKRTLAEVMQEALVKDYGQRELNNLGRNGGSVRWDGTCGDCGVRWSARGPEGLRGAPLVCGYCARAYATDAGVLLGMGVLA